LIKEHDALLEEINAKFGRSLEVKLILVNPDICDEVLVKSQSSVSSMLAYHDKELEAAIETYIAYLEAIAETVEGEISKSDGFYNNSKIFKRLFN